MGHDKMRNRTYRRALFALILATGPVVTACEAVLEFDRTPLQPVYEAGVEDEEEADGSPDGRAEGGRQGQDAGGRDAPSEARPADTGTDAENG
jgi:hypothetical protein